MFYISSATKTSTLSTRFLQSLRFQNYFSHFLFVSTVCFKSSGTLATCSKKKRRRDIMEDALHEENEIRISPSVNEHTEDLEEGHNLRDPRFLTTCDLNPKLSKLADSYYTGQL